MIRLQNTRFANAASLKRVAILCTAWLLVSLALSFTRITHRAFGLEGDLPFHYHITRSYARSFDEGDLLPRWAGMLDGGNGDALFTFYPPLSYLLSAVLIKLGIDSLTALKIVTVLILSIAQAGAYLFARASFNRRGSLAASVLYVALPAYPLIGLKLAFFANAFALSLVPFALLGAHETLVGRRRARGLIFFVFGTSGIILSHIVTTYICGIVIALMVLLYLPQVGWRGLARLAGAGLLVLALTAFFLVPLKIEMNGVRAELQVGRHDYHNYFLFAKTQDSSNYHKMWGDLNLSASYITLSQIALTSLLCLACLPILRRRDRMAAPVLLGLTIAAFTLVISLPRSDVIWRYLPGLKFIQFPWRFLPFVSLGCGLVVATAFTPQSGNQSSWRMLKPVHRALISLLLTWIVIMNMLFTWAVTHVQDSGFTKEQVAKLLNSPDVPKIPYEALDKLENQDDFQAAAYKANPYFYRPKTADLDLYPPASQPGGLTLLRGRGRVTSQHLYNERREFIVECEEPVQARVETYYYPHWIAQLDGREIPINLEPETGLMLVDLPTGTHKLSFAFEPRNQIEIWAYRISLLTWILFIAWIIRRLQTDVAAIFANPSRPSLVS